MGKSLMAEGVLVKASDLRSVSFQICSNLLRHRLMNEVISICASRREKFEGFWLSVIE